MKKNITCIVAFSMMLTALSLQSVAQLPNTWTQKADFGGAARYGAVSFNIGNKGYLGTGWASFRVKDFWEYDPATDTWSQKADFGGTARVFATGFSIGSKGYIGCGNDGNPTNDFWEYNPVSNIWIQKASFSGLIRDGAVGFNIGTKGYIGTGLTATTIKLKDFWEYDPATDAWTQKSNVGGPARAYAAGFSIGNKGYIGTGNTGSLERDFWEYNPSTDTWTQKANFGGSARFAAVGVSIGAFGYIGFGDIGGGYNIDFWGYNPALDTWTQETNFGGALRSASSGFSIGNKGYFGTGTNGILAINYKDFWEYTPYCTPPSITVQPVNQTLTFGASAIFTVAANDAVSYQWQENTGAGFVNITDGGIYSNATTPSLSLSLPTVSMSGYKYRCVVSSSCPPSIATNGDATLSVTAKSIVITPDAGQTKVFGSNDPTPFSYTYAPSLIGVDAITGLMSRATGENVGTFVYAIGTLSAGNNYSLSVAATPVFTITPKPVIISATAGQVKVFGSPDPVPFTYTYSPSLAGSDAITGLMGRAAGENAGTYIYTIGTLSAGNNYSLSIANTPVFTISTKAVVITANANQTKVYGSADPVPFSYTYSPSLVGSDAITGLMGRVAGENAGTYIYTMGTLSAGNNYSLSVESTPVFTITAKAVVVTANANQTKVFGSVDPVFTYTCVPSLVGGDVFTGVINRISGENTGLYAFTQGSLSAGPNYIFTFVTSNFSITPKPILITANSGQSKIYGSADPATFTYIFTPALVGTDIITGSLSRTPGENAGNYPFTIGTLTAGTNYSLSVSVAPSFSITQKTLTITAENKNKCYDGAIFGNGYTVTYNGFVNGEDHTVLGNTLIFGGTAITAVNPGNYTIIPSGLTSANYSIIFMNGILQINPSLAPTITGINSLCAGSSAVEYTTEPGFSNYIWTISYGGVITGGLNTNHVTVEWGTAGSRSISVNYLNTSGCFSSAPTSYNVTVLSVPVPVIFGEESVCSGKSGVVYSTQMNQNNYSWNVSSGGTVISGAGTSSITVNWTGSGNQTVSVDYTNASGCQALSPSVLNVNVTHEPLPSGPVSGPGKVCAGSGGNEYSIAPIAAATSYEWTVPSGAIIVSGAGTTSITVDFTSSASAGNIGVYGVNGCGAGASSPGFYVQVNPVPPAPSIAQHGDTLVSSANSGNQWYLDDVEIPGATGQKYIAYTVGNYYVITTQNGCSSTASNSIQLVTITANEINISTSYQLYPNPNEGIFDIKVETAGREIYNIEICNNLGTLVWKQDGVNINGTYTAHVDLYSSPAGMYTVALRNKANSIVKKVVIMK